MGSRKVDGTIKMCEVGDILYKITKGEIVEITVTDMRQNMFDTYIYDYNGSKSNYFFNKNIGSNYFKTREEAEQKLQEKDNIAKKRKLLREYERKLNEELNLGNHYIIK